MKTEQTTNEIVNDLLKTYEGVEGTAIDPSSWYNELISTSEFYGISIREAHDIHSIAYYRYINSN